MLPQDPWFIAIAVLTVLPAMVIFVARRVIHAVIALAVSFVGSAFVFLYLNQPMVALLQVFVFVGGLSTYLIVAVATEEARRHTNPLYFFALLVLLSAALSLVFSGAGAQGPLLGNSFLGAASTALSTYYALLYALALLLFSAVMGSILIIKKFVRLVV